MMREHSIKAKATDTPSTLYTQVSRSFRFVKSLLTAVLCSSSKWSSSSRELSTASSQEGNPRDDAQTKVGAVAAGVALFGLGSHSGGLESR